MNRADYSYVTRRLGEDYLFAGMYKKSLKYFKEYNAIIQIFDPNVPYAYWQDGQKKEADRYFNAHQEFCQKVINTDYSSRSESMGIL